MTDQELNEKIARLMGCTRDADNRWWTPYRNTWAGAPPNYLAQSRLAELVDLANKVLGPWTLMSRVPGEVGDLFLAMRTPETIAARNDPHESYGKTSSLALARTIVRYAESAKGKTS